VCFMISVNIIKVLGEGGFSFVYLAQDETSGVSDFMSSFLTTSYIWLVYM
jgi:serine/threonine protein kinase